MIVVRLRKRTRGYLVSLLSSLIYLSITGVRRYLHTLETGECSGKIRGQRVGLLPRVVRQEYWIVD